MGNICYCLCSRSSSQGISSMDFLDYLKENGWWSAIKNYWTNGKFHIRIINNTVYLRDEHSMPITEGTAEEIKKYVEKNK